MIQVSDPPRWYLGYLLFMSEPGPDQAGAQAIPFIEAPPIFCGPGASQNYRLPAEAVRSNVDSEQHGHFQEHRQA